MKKSIPLITLLFGISALVGQIGVAADDKPHVVLVAGTLHYSPELTLPVFAEELERLGFRTTVVIGEGDPEKKTENALPGIGALADADAAIFFMRFLKLPDDEWQPIEDYITAGKPVIGLRTANHSFKYPKGHKRFEWNDGFGRRVLGTPYIVHQQGFTDISVVERHLKHPIMTHVDTAEWKSLGTLYLTRLEPGCIPLMAGIGKGKMRVLERSFGTTLVNESEADIVAWAWENEWGGKVFGSTLGHPGDFGEEAFNRMLINSVCWAVGKPMLDADAAVSTWDIKRADK
ncbi:MAG TPA: hypothetical protein DIV79_16430 [Opitutae bacterium]|nr:hypothetical protein [Opitutaceae bacterium]MEC7906330.1 ThuA domain-containing protein [Verrucomicrobiota bacterium]HCR31592.1 hypothetical protein [Opitutae bacterium]